MDFDIPDYFYTLTQDHRNVKDIACTVRKITTITPGLYVLCGRENSGKSTLITYITLAAGNRGINKTLHCNGFVPDEWMRRIYCNPEKITGMLIIITDIVLDDYNLSRMEKLSSDNAIVLQLSPHRPIIKQAKYIYLTNKFHGGMALTDYNPVSELF